jgi:hypothetical protein
MPDMSMILRRMQPLTGRLPVLVAVSAFSVAAAASAGCDIVTAELKHTETAEWRKNYELQPGGRVEIGNVNGKIEVERSTANTVEVLATKSARGATREAARQVLERVEIIEGVSSSEIRIETRIPRMGGMFHSGSAQVKYAVKVPAGADVKFSTTNGGIEARGLSGRIDVETTNGGITAREIDGTIEASTTNGGVDVDVIKLGEGGAKLECTNGGIRFRLPADAKATIVASVTNGGIDTGGLQLETTESSRRRLEGRLNGGGPPVRIEGTNGGIRISAR